MEPEVWLADYVRIYVERDVQEVLIVGDLEAFVRWPAVLAQAARARTPATAVNRLCRRNMIPPDME